AEDKRITLYRAWLRGPELLTEDGKGIFQDGQIPFDVIILGDVSAQQLRDADKDAFTKIADRVTNKRTGLLMMGGRYAFSKSEWGGTEIEKMLPVRLSDLDERERQSTLAVKLKPTEFGLRYVLRLADRPEDSIEKWKQMPELTGITKFGD